MKYCIIVEALVSLCIYTARRDYNYTPRTYADSVSVVERLGLMECINDLVSLVRLRNLVMHRYRIIEDHKIHQAIREDFGCVRRLLEVEVMRKQG